MSPSVNQGMNQYQLPIFEGLCPSWGNILSLGVRRTFPKGARILDLEFSDDGIYWVAEGNVEVVLYTLHGPEKVLYYIGPGGVFGEVSCFAAGGISEAWVDARTPCVLYFFSRAVIEAEIATQHPQVMLELVRALSTKIRMYAVLLKDSLTSDKFIRVCKMLVYLVQYRGGQSSSEQKQVAFRPELTQSDMARLMGVHRVTVTKAISRLKALGIVVHFSKNSLEILDFPALCALIEKAEA
jgi:CRP-like cAMP-binding protein